MPSICVVMVEALALTCPLERYRDLWLKPDHFSVEGASHWGLVLNRRALGTMIPAVLSWIENTIQQGRPTS